jgi:alpha-L-rhamnosidase
VAVNEQPFAGKWCWPEKHLLHPWNTFVYFRRTVELKSVPRQAPVRVSADARYTLYVNGKRLHHGPARYLVETPSYDTLDLAPLLRRGVNTLCAIAHQFGIPTFFHQYRDHAGFFLDGEIDGTSVSTPDGWLCRHAKAWKKDTARKSVQMGFQEHFDADADPADWMAPDYVADEKTGWAAPKWSLPANSHPWLKFEPRVVQMV